MSKTQTQTPKTKTIKGFVLDADGDLVQGLIEVPDTEEDKRRAFNPAVDKAPAKGMKLGAPENKSEGAVTGVNA